MMIPHDVVEKEPSKARTCALENLGLPRTATDAEARTAYKKLAREHHPDKGGDAEKFKVINQANEILAS